MEFLNYGDHPLQKIKVFHACPGTKDTVAFIHGGGWRDPANSYDDFEPIMNNFSSAPYNVVSINYRLSPRVNTQEEVDALSSFKHPYHLLDAAMALLYLENHGFSPIALVGHSVGAGMCLQLSNFSQIMAEGVKYQQIEDDCDWKRFNGSLSTIKLQALFVIDGIYDVEQLIKEYGDDYRSFVRCAFANDDHFTTAFPTSNHNLGGPSQLVSSQTKWIVVHSTEDELVSTNQSELLIKYLTKTHQTVQKEFHVWGKHEEVYTRQEIGQLIRKIIDI